MKYCGVIPISSLAGFWEFHPYMHLFSFRKPFYDLYICTSPRNLHKLLVVLFSHLTPMTSCQQLSDYHCVSLMPRSHPLIIRNVSGNSWALSWLGGVSSLIYRTALYQASIFSLWNNAMWYRHVINGLSLDCWQPKRFSCHQTPPHILQQLFWCALGTTTSSKDCTHCPQYSLLAVQQLVG